MLIIVWLRKRFVFVAQKKSSLYFQPFRGLLRNVCEVTWLHRFRFQKISKKKLFNFFLVWRKSISHYKFLWDRLI